MMKTINIGISDLNVSRSPDILATYALGSCVGICLFDKYANVGGLAHIMLPESKDNVNNVGNMRRYADTAIYELIRTMTFNGSKPSNMKAKIAGGAQMFQTKLDSFNIGERNIEAVKKYLAYHSIPIIAEDTGGNYGRTVFFNLSNGIMQIKSATKGIIEL